MAEQENKKSKFHRLFFSRFNYNASFKNLYLFLQLICG